MTNYIDKLQHLDKQIKQPEIHAQVDEVLTIISAVAKGQVLKNAPQKLGFEPDQLEELEIEAGPDKKKAIKAINHLLNGVRQYLSLKFGIWSLPNLATAQLIKEKLHIHTALEVMAGNAYWSKALQEAGIKTIATDSLEWARTSKTGQSSFIPVENLTATEAVKKYTEVDLVLCSWSPNFGHSDLDLIKSWQANSHACLLFIGEKEGATNSPEFWLKTQFKSSPELNAINHSFASYDFIDEKFYEIFRK